MPDTAVFSGPDGCYRYHLRRLVNTLGTGTVCFVMLNPSTADAAVNDPTVRRCIGFARRWGHMGLEVVNLFAWRATDPERLKTAHDPIGPENDTWLLQTAQEADLVVAAWGNGGSLRGRSARVIQLLQGAGIQAWRLGDLTVAGEPRHPLYLPRKTQLTELYGLKGVTE